jgi:hypothetical protein
MKDQGRENLAELIQRLLDAEQADTVLEDIRQGEQILAENPAPRPDRQLMDNIKAEIAELLSIRRARSPRRQMYKKIAVAAAFLIIASIGAILFNDGQPAPTGRYQIAGVISPAIWESDDIAADDENLAVFASQIEQIENEVMTLEADDDVYASDRSVEELEMELIVVRNDFWKE